MDKPVCKLIGKDGNAFSIIGYVSKTLQKAGQTEQAKEFTSKAVSAGSYNELLQLAIDYVEVR